MRPDASAPGFRFQLPVSSFQTLHLIVDVEDAVLAVTQQHQFGGAQAGDLAAQFRADRPTGARHQHALAAHQRRHLRRVDLHRRAAQQILDLYFPELADTYPATNQLIQTRNDTRLYPGFAAKGDNLPDDHCRMRSAWQ